MAVILQFGAGAAFATTSLDHALSFAAISMGQNVTVGPSADVTGTIGAQRATIGKTASTQDVVTSPGGINLARDAEGDACITSGAKVHEVTNGSCTSIDTSGSNPELATLGSAIDDIAAYATAAASQTPTQTLSAIKVGTNGFQTITDTIVGGLNVISVPSISIGNGGILDISGGSSDTVLILVTGTVKLAPGASLAIEGGIPASAVLIMAAGKSVSVARDAVLDASVVAPNANCILSTDGILDGSFYCGKHISLGQLSDSGGDPSTVVLP